MTIIKQTPNHLIIQSRPSMRVLLCAVGFIALGLLVLEFFGRVKTLTCNRVAPSQTTCVVTASNFRNPRLQEIPIEQLQGADLEYEKISTTKAHYHIVLLTDRGRLPFSPDYAIPVNKEKRNTAKPPSLHIQSIVSQINSFVQSSSKSSLLVQDSGPQWVAYPYGAGFILFGLLVFFAFINNIVNPESCTFDKTRQRVTLKLQGLPGNSRTEHSFSEIINVELVEQQPGFVDHLIYLKNRSQETGQPIPWFIQLGYLASGGELSHLMYKTKQFPQTEPKAPENDKKSYYIRLVLVSGDRPCVTASANPDQQKQQAIVEQIRTFLNL